MHNELVNELSKPAPDYDRIKQLKEWENRLKQQASGGVAVGQQTSEMRGSESSGSASYFFMVFYVVEMILLTGMGWLLRTTILVTWWLLLA